MDLAIDILTFEPAKLMNLWTTSKIDMNPTYISSFQIGIHSNSLKQIISTPTFISLGLCNKNQSWCFKKHAIPNCFIPLREWIWTQLIFCVKSHVKEVLIPRPVWVIVFIEKFLIYEKWYKNYGLDVDQIGLTLSYLWKDTSFYTYCLSL